jgi:hypothetical protein
MKACQRGIRTGDLDVVDLAAMVPINRAGEFALERWLHAESGRPVSTR